MLDFTQNPVAVSNEPYKATLPTENSMAIAQVVPIYEVAKKKFSRHVLFLSTKNQRVTFLMTVLYPIIMAHQDQNYPHALTLNCIVL